MHCMEVLVLLWVAVLLVKNCCIVCKSTQDWVLLREPHWLKSRHDAAHKESWPWKGAQDGSPPSGQGSKSEANKSCDLFIVLEYDDLYSKSCDGRDRQRALKGPFHFVDVLFQPLFLNYLFTHTFEYFCKNRRYQELKIKPTNDNKCAHKTFPFSKKHPKFSIFLTISAD